MSSLPCLVSLAACMSLSAALAPRVALAEPPDVAAAPADSAPAVPEAVLAMVGRNVVLTTKENETIAGRLLSADSNGFSIDEPDHGAVVVPRDMARGIRLEESAPAGPPPAGDSHPPAPPYTQPPIEGEEIQDTGRPRKGTGKIIGGSILTGLSIPFAIAGGVVVANADSYRGNANVREAQTIAGASVLVLGGICVLVGIPLLVSGISDRRSGRVAWVGAPGGAGWMWRF